MIQENPSRSNFNWISISIRLGNLVMISTNFRGLRATRSSNVEIEDSPCYSIDALTNHLNCESSEHTSTYEKFEQRPHAGSKKSSHTLNYFKGAQLSNYDSKIKTCALCNVEGLIFQR